MYKNFFVKKTSGTYAETLEAYGLAILLKKVTQELSLAIKVTLIDKDGYYLLTLDKEITQQMLEGLSYFPLIKFLIKDETTLAPKELGQDDYFDYPAQNEIKDGYKEKAQLIEENEKLSSEEKKKAYADLNELQNSEFNEKLDKAFDVYRELKRNPYSAYMSAYENLTMNKENFASIIKSLLEYYITGIEGKITYSLKAKKITSQQLLNPYQGKGLNKPKSNDGGMGNLKSSWITESMKIIGAIEVMTIQFIKVGTDFDLKIYVLDFKVTNIGITGLPLIVDFKRELKTNSSVKLDILNMFRLVTLFIKHDKEYKKKPKQVINGFHTVYQKKLGFNRAVANISFLGTPNFIEYSNKQEARDWITILESQESIIKSIEENGDAIQALQAYRNFLSSTKSSSLDDFHQFYNWYAGYLVRSLANEKYYIKPFRVETLSRFYQNMQTENLDLMQIIENEGFKAVAKAIRKSTVSLQYTPKENRKFEIRYGLSQQLQNKSKSKEDLTTFIGDFISTYNAETARFVEKQQKEVEAKEETYFRANVKVSELNQFYDLVNQYSSRLIGALLTSYGFALEGTERKELSSQENK
ncbi:hypothetical protein [Flammeovirga sp. EKP202]|uniref:hypothetical protein n=1 Tax=Flammeovirga sp. EKP202 TaxID=2770592 RepID=UPI00165F7106|nr:hypothetical protein [Flammeovirga sp. EKP202]MBD0402741.1 hypothetical protein [Flammeovirga sp. EKP202]